MVLGSNGEAEGSDPRRGLGFQRNSWTGKQNIEFLEPILRVKKSVQFCHAVKKIL